MNDQTLADYIKRTMENLEKDEKKPLEEKSNPNYYPVYPEDDYDTPKNPYGNH